MPGIMNSLMKGSCEKEKGRTARPRFSGSKALRNVTDPNIMEEGEITKGKKIRSEKYQKRIDHFAYFIFGALFILFNIYYWIIRQMKSINI